MERAAAWLGWTGCVAAGLVVLLTGGDFAADVVDRTVGSDVAVGRADVAAGCDVLAGALLVLVDWAVGLAAVLLAVAAETTTGRLDWALTVGLAAVEGSVGLALGVAPVVAPSGVSLAVLDWLRSCCSRLILAPCERTLFTDLAWLPRPITAGVSWAWDPVSVWQPVRARASRDAKPTRAAHDGALRIVLGCPMENPPCDGSREPPSLQCPCTDLPN